MCGFVGTFGVNAGRAKEKIIVASEIIKHRGPDSTEIFAGDYFACGFNRLKIIDLSDSANQPFDDGRFVLVFNGEIYNYVELKETLALNTKTSSDTEVLFEVLKLYKDVPEKGLNLLNGMFAFAFYDRVENKLILGRDRLGVKPLNYRIDGSDIFFASEIKALKPFIGNFKPDHKSVVNYLIERAFDYDERTFFEGVNQVRPGTFLKCKLNNNEIVVERCRYWDISKVKTREVDDNEAIVTFKKLFFDAVDIRLRADVPVSVLLSGGLDSSAIASVMANSHPSREVATISAVYAGSKFDEKVFAEKVVNMYKNIKPTWVEIESDKLAERIEQAVWHEEIPLPDGSMVAHFSLMEKIRDLKMRVVLTGQGGDEILGGYVHTFLPAAEADGLRRFSIKNLNFSALFHALPPAVKNLARKIKIRKDYGRFFLRKSELSLVDDFYGEERGGGVLRSYLIESLIHWSLPGFLHYDDGNSMGCAIESRAPFLDYRLVEFMISLPAKMKIRNGLGKWLLRESLAGIVPSEILKRKDKQGFHAPLEMWSASLKSEYLTDNGFKNEFDYINLEKASTDVRMNWKVCTLWVWYKLLVKQHNL